MQMIKANIMDADLVGYIHSTAWKQAYTEMFPIEYLDEDTPQTRTNEFLEALNNKSQSQNRPCVVRRCNP